jgi:acyl-CoA thioester hydrolase
MAEQDAALEPSAGGFVVAEHRLAVRVYYEDTDFTGLVYHASYIRFFERGRSDFLRLIGIGHADLARQDTVFAVTRLEVAFHRAARIDDALVVASRLVTAKGVRVRFAQTITRGGDAIASATVEVACIDRAGRPRRPPPGLAAALIARVDLTAV